MLLAIDVGNTHTVFGLWEGSELRGSWRLFSDTQRSVDGYALELTGLLASSGFALSVIQDVVIACVVPPLTRVFSKLAQKYFSVSALVVGPGVKTGMPIAVDDPRGVGADRIVNAVAAKEMYGTPVVVVDFGTATSFDVVGQDGSFQGGIIAPGVLVSADALFEKASMLPSIELKHPEVLIGKNTTEAMLSGIVFGYVELVDGLLARLQKELGDETRTICTGGLAQMIGRDSRYIREIVPDLTLQGLRMVAEKNRER